MSLSRQRGPVTLVHWFWWQGLLIVLPVLILALVGFAALLQDKQLAQREAEDRAQAIAETTAAELWRNLTSVVTAIEFGGAGASTSRICVLDLDTDLQLRAPPDYAEVPAPVPLDLSLLSAAQRALWEAGVGGQGKSGSGSGDGAGGDEVDPLAEVWERFLETQPPAPFAQQARWSLLRVKLAAHRLDSALADLRFLGDSVGGIVLESGLPLEPLVGLKWLELSAAEPERVPLATDRLETICSNAVRRPSFLSKMIFREIRDRVEEFSEDRSLMKVVIEWANAWAKDELGRSLHRDIRRSERDTASLKRLMEGGTAAQFWLESAERWFVLDATPSPRGHLVVCWPEEQLRERVERLLAQGHVSAEAFGVGVKIGNKTIVPEKSGASILGRGVAPLPGWSKSQCN